MTRLRRRIDEVDLLILQHINERTLVVEEIGKVKREFGLPIYEPKREDDVYRNVTGNNQGPLPPDAVRRIFERIIDEMRTVQRNRMLAEQERVKAESAKGPGSK
ncbi:MAG: chorismate mutase [Acidobacteria bacterium]|nr:chorismate mutase [Acidobacteriota bacterium]